MYFFGRVQDFFPPLPAYTSPGILLHARTCTQKKSGSPQRLPSCFCQSCLIAFLMHAYGFPLFDMSSTISRVLYLMTIFLDCMSPCSSSAFSRNATYRKARRAAVSPSLPQNRGMFWSCFRWGLHSLPCYQGSGGLLHHHSTLTGIPRRFLFCCTGLGVTPTGRYPAPCPVKPGLSSRKAGLPQPSARSSVLLTDAYFIICRG